MRFKQSEFDILLINPPPVPNWDYQKKNNYSAPAWLLSIGTVLKKNGFSVKLLDGAYEEDYLIQMENIIKKSNLLYLGISVMTAQLPSALKIAGKARKINSRICLVWGGVHPTLFPDQTAMHELVDIVVIGEGEYTSLELANNFKNNEDYRYTKGTITKVKNRIIKNDKREFLDLEKLPFFDYNLLEIEKYILQDKTDIGGQKLKGGPLRRSLAVLSGLGCPYQCAFCIESIVRKKYRQRTAESLITEIERLIEQYGINDIGFVDDLFFADKKRLLQFLVLLEERKIDISWSTTVRANYFNDEYLNQGLLKRIRHLGGFHFGLGAESGSENILTKIDKQINKQDVIRAAKWCKEADINIGFSFMIGLPGETEEEMRETVGFAFSLINENPKNSYIIGPNVFRAYPGSSLFNEVVEKYHFLIPHSLEKWSEVFSLGEGYFKVEKLPWIKNPALLQILSFYLFQGTTNFVYPKFWMRFGSLILKKLCRLRLKFKFFYFPFEYKIATSLRGIILNEK